MKRGVSGSRPQRGSVEDQPCRRGTLHIAARLMETFAAYTAQTNFHVRRILDTLDAIGG